MSVSRRGAEVRLAWVQPPGLWRARAAHPLLERLGAGGPLAKVPLPLRPEDQAVDDRGFGPWHYWAHSPHPEESWDWVRHHLPSDHRDSRALDGSHPWHALALRGQALALGQWQATWGLPADVGPDHQSQSLLHLAAWSGDAVTVLAVLAHQTPWLNSRDQQGLTPLMIAAHRCCVSLQALLASGADPNVLDDQGRSALHHAALYGDFELLAPLEQAGGHMEWPDAHGQTPEQILEVRSRRSTKDQASFRTYWARRYRAKLAF